MFSNSFFMPVLLIALAISLFQTIAWAFIGARKSKFGFPVLASIIFGLHGAVTSIVLCSVVVSQAGVVPIPAPSAALTAILLALSVACGLFWAVLAVLENDRSKRLCAIALTFVSLVFCSDMFDLMARLAGV